MGHQSETPRGIGGHRSLLICVKSKHGCSSGMIGWTFSVIFLSKSGPRACLQGKEFAYLRVCARYFGLTTQQSALIFIHAGPQGLLGRRPLKGLFNRTPRAVGPMSPDTLNPIGLFIIHYQQASRPVVNSCETGGLEGPLGQKSILAVQLWGEPALRAFPPHPPFTSTTCCWCKFVGDFEARGRVLPAAGVLGLKLASN